MRGASIRPAFGQAQFGKSNLILGDLRLPSFAKATTLISMLME